MSAHELAKKMSRDEENQIAKTQWFKTRLAKDNSLLTLSSWGIGLQVTQASITQNLNNYFVVLVCIVSVLCFANYV